MDTSNLTKPGAAFEYQGRLFILRDFYMVPSCNVFDPVTGEVMNFGMGGLTADGFKPLDIDADLFIPFVTALYDRDKEQREVIDDYHGPATTLAPPK